MFLFCVLVAFVPMQPPSGSSRSDVSLPDRLRAIRLGKWQQGSTEADRAVPADADHGTCNLAFDSFRLMVSHLCCRFRLLRLALRRMHLFFLPPRQRRGQPDTHGHPQAHGHSAIDAADTHCLVSWLPILHVFFVSSVFASSCFCSLGLGHLLLLFLFRVFHLASSSWMFLFCVLVAFVPMQPPSGSSRSGVSLPDRLRAIRLGKWQQGSTEGSLCSVFIASVCSCFYCS